MSLILPCRLLFVSCRLWSRYLLLAMALLLVSGCVHDDTQPAIEDAAVTAPATAEAEPPAIPESSVYAWLKQAETAASPERESLLLQAAEYYRQQSDYTRLGLVLHEIKPDTLSGELLLHYSLLYGDWSLAQRHLDDAARVLLNPALSAVTSPDNASAARLHELRARLYELQNKPLDALHERLLQSALEPENARQAVNEAIWRQISSLRGEDFSVLEYADTSNKAEEQLLAGWVALARVQRNHAGDVDKQIAALADWKSSYPVHPANRFMPAEMLVLTQAQVEQPKRIALLLPLTGKRADAGQSLRDGFMTMHYQHLADSKGLQIDLVDSSAAPDILSAYNSAVAQGAQLVIGPLEREQVQVLANQQSLPVPTLALNNPILNDPSGNKVSAPDALYQFSLNPEEEAAQVADTANTSGLRRALIIAPQGERGERLLQAFARRWQMFGAEETGRVRYVPGSGNYGVQLAEALGMDLASGQLRAGHGLPDMVFFVGSSADAAAMMAALTNTGVGQVPVYATSQVLSGGHKLDARTNGLRLCLSPWQAGAGPLRSAGAAPASADILFAMGADAQMLYSRLQSMSINPSLRVPGNTGYLSMDGGRRVVRALVWGVLKDGQLQVQPANASR